MLSPSVLRRRRLAGRSAVVVAAAAALIMTSRTSSASGPWPSCDQKPARTEFEMWLAIGGGARTSDRVDASGYFELAADLAATFPLGGAARVGPWARVGTTFQSFDPGAGLRLVVMPTDLDWFATHGRMELTLDAGAGYTARWGPLARFFGDHAFATGRLSFGFRAPLRLYDLYPQCSCAAPSPSDFNPEDGRPTCRPPVAMVSGVRIYGGARRSLQEKELWDLSFGLSFEVLGSSWFLLGAN